nr:hypothetical protein [Pedobacter sp. ASV12]
MFPEGFQQHFLFGRLAQQDLCYGLGGYPDSRLDKIAPDFQDFQMDGINKGIDGVGVLPGAYGPASFAVPSFRFPFVFERDFFCQPIYGNPDVNMAERRNQ